MLRWTYRRTCLAVAAAFLVGCGFTAPRVRYFDVRPIGIERQEGERLPPIAVPDFGCSSTYDHVRVVLRRSPVEVVSSRNLQWTTAPGRMLAQGMRYRLGETGRFESVKRDKGVRLPYTAEGVVQAIELNEEPRLTARLALQVSVRRSLDGIVIYEESVDETQAASGEDPAEGVVALRALYSEILDGLVERVIKAVEDD